MVASAAVSISRKLGLGAILGLLGTGMVLGPFTPGPMLTRDVEEVRRFSELGVVFLMFLIGLEMHPKQLWAMRRQLFGMGGCQIAFASAGLWGAFAAAGMPGREALVAGFALALSSTAFVLQILKERGALNLPHGAGSFAVLLMQDLAVVPLLSLLPFLSESGARGDAAALWAGLGKAAGMVALVCAAGKWAVPRILDALARQGNKEGFFLVSLCAMFLSAVAMDYAGASMGMGAFLMGMMLSDSRYCYQIELTIEPFKGLLMSMFFVAVGMSIDPEPIRAAPWRFMGLLGVALGVKIAAMWAAGALFGQKREPLAKMSFLLAQGGEFGFVVFGSAKAAGLIGADAFALGVALVSVTMAATPLLAKAGDWAAGMGRKRSYRTVGLDGLPAQGAQDCKAQAVIAGYGRMGHTVGQIFEAEGIAYVAFDSSAKTVGKWRSLGHPVFYGDLSDPQVLANNALSSAKIVVLTMDDQQAALKAAKALKMSNPALRIVARAKDLSACDEFALAGVECAVPETLEASLRVASECLQLMGDRQEAAEERMREVRRREIVPDSRQTEQ